MIRRILTLASLALAVFTAQAQSLSAQQISTLRAACTPDPTCNALAVAGNDSGLAGWFNDAAAPAWFVWRSTTAGDDILDAIVWASLTPADTADGTATYTNRALVIQAKQINLQIMLQGRSTIPTAKLNIRQGLQDALSNVPSGVAGALVDAGWLGAGKVKTTITRTSTRAEKLLSTGTGTSGVPAALGWEGVITQSDASLLR